jgi:hypothetical protein
MQKSRDVTIDEIVDVGVINHSLISNLILHPLFIHNIIIYYVYIIITRINVFYTIDRVVT